MLRCWLTVRQKRRDTKCQYTVPEPIGRCRKRHCLCTDLSWVDFRRISPGCWAPCSRKSTDKKISHCDDSLRNWLIVVNNPCDIRVRRILVLGDIRNTIRCLESADNKEEGHHEERSYKQRGSTAEAIKIDDGRKCEENVQDVLNRGCEKRRRDVGTFHNICSLSVLNLL